MEKNRRHAYIVVYAGAFSFTTNYFSSWFSHRIDNLEGFILKEHNRKVKCEFSFNKNAEKYAIQSALGFGYEKLHLAYTIQSGPRIFDEWENTYSFYDFRKADVQEIEDKQKIITSKLPKADFKLQKSLLNDGYILHIETSNIIDPDKYNAFKQAIFDLNTIDSITILLFSDEGLYYIDNC